jgi:hypothetical protein
MAAVLGGEGVGSEYPPIDAMSTSSSSSSSVAWRGYPTDAHHDHLQQPQQQQHHAQGLLPGWSGPLSLPPPPPPPLASHEGQGDHMPPRRASKTPPPRGAGSWDAVKPLIKHHYLDERRPLRDVMQIMETRYGFQAT